MLSVSLRISEETFEGVDRELRPPGLSYVRSVNSSQDPGSVLWPIEGTNEGVLDFRLSHLPDSSYLPETIQFNFPIEILTFSPPSLDNTGPKLLKFSHNRGRLSFTNPPGEPPTQNPPLNETRIRTQSNHSSRNQSNHSQQFQEGGNQYEDQYQAPPPPNQLPGGFPRQVGSNDARMGPPYDPTILPPNLHQQNLYQKGRGFFSPNAVNKAIQDAIDSYPQPMPRSRPPAIPPPWHRLPLPFQSPSGRKPSSPSIPKPPIKNKTGRENASSPDLFNST